MTTRTPETTPPVTWVLWMVNPSAERLSAYRASGVRVRMRGNVAQVALMDEDDAKAVDILEEASGRCATYLKRPILVWKR